MLVLVVIKLIAMIESKTEVEEGAMSDKRMVGGRAFKQQLILFTCLALSVLFLPHDPEDNQRCQQTVLSFRFVWFYPRDSVQMEIGQM